MSWHYNSFLYIRKRSKHGNHDLKYLLGPQIVLVLVAAIRSKNIKLGSFMGSNHKEAIPKFIISVRIITACGNFPHKYYNSTIPLELSSWEDSSSTCGILCHSHHRTEAGHHSHLSHTSCRSCTRYTARGTSAQTPSCFWWTVNKLGDLKCNS